MVQTQYQILLRQNKVDSYSGNCMLYTAYCHLYIKILIKHHFNKNMLTNNSQCYRVMIAFIDIRKTLLFRMVESEGTKKPWQPRCVRKVPT